jgi:nicotinate-nucleotide--dimethylbenzimidazole phosphoribosyltransferase
LKNKYSQKCLDNYEGENNLESKLAYFGGFEIMQMVGAMLEAKNRICSFW